MFYRFSFILGVVLFVFATSASAAKTPDNIRSVSSLSSTSITDLGTLNLATGQISTNASRQLFETIWDNTDFTASYFDIATAELIDTGDLPSGTWIDKFSIGFATDAGTAVTLRISFYQTDAFNNPDPLVPLLKADGTPAVYDFSTAVLSGVPGNGPLAYSFDVSLPEDLQFQITGADLDGDNVSDWGYGYQVLDAGDSTTLGPLISGEGLDPVGAQGRWDAFDLFDPPGTYVTTTNFGGSIFAQFHMRLREGTGPIYMVPAMNSFGVILLSLLLAMGGMLVVRRFRKV